MKGVFALLAAVVLSLTFSATADETSTLDPLSSALFLDTLATPGQPCEPSIDLPFAVNSPEPMQAAGNCGACSSSDCVGKPRGSLCYLGLPQGGYGGCNIYSGGYKCPTGGWHCECGTGPLP